MPKLKAASLRRPFNFNGVGWRKIVAEKMGDVGLRRLSYLCLFFLCLIAAACSDSSTDEPDGPFTVGGTVSGVMAPILLAYSGVSYDEGTPSETSDAMTVSDGEFRFSGSERNLAAFASGASY